MTHRILSCLIALTFLLSSTGPLLAAQPSQQSPLITTAAMPTQAAVSQALHTSPVMFIENAGQFADGARFQVRGGNGTVWLAEDALWITITAREQAARPNRDPRAGLPTAEPLADPETPRAGANFRLSFPGANVHPRIEPFDRLDTVVSYFMGNDPDKWRPDVPVWGGVRYVDLYPGVDLEITSEGGQMVQRLAARPDVDLAAVQLRVEGADDVTVYGDALRLSTAAGKFALPLLRADGLQVAGLRLQPRGTQAVDVAAPFAPANAKPASRDTSNRQSAIHNLQSPADNPADLLYATFLGGGSYDDGAAIALDGAGSAYVTGRTQSTNFPTTPGTFDTSFNGSDDAFVVKLNRGGGLAYATFLGGSSQDSGHGIALDGAGCTYVTGWTQSTNFPATPGAFDTSYNSGWDAFMVKLNSAGGLAYATFLGGSGSDGGFGIAVDGAGSACVTGYTSSSDFPTMPGAFDTSFNGSDDAFVVKLNPLGGLAYATFLGGSGGEFSYGIVLDGAGSAYVTGRTQSTNFPITLGAFDTSYNSGWDAFMVKLNPAGGLAYATFLGGGSYDAGAAIALDGAGSAYVTGITESSDFPATPGAFDTSFNGSSDGFVVKLNPVGSELAYATFVGGLNVGGQGVDIGDGIALDGTGSAYVTGYTSSSDFPTTPGTFDTSFNGSSDGFVVKLNPGGGLAYATFLGGSSQDSGHGIALDGAGCAYVTGTTNSSDFPTTPGVFDTSYNSGQDAFMAKLAMGGGAAVAISGHVTDGSGNAIAGVTVSAGAAGSATTDGIGNYTLGGLTAGTYTLTPSKSGYIFSPASRTVTVPPDATGQDFIATPDVLDVGFTPNPNGYSFSNSDDSWGSYPWPPALDDFTTADMRVMFGDSQVCHMVSGICTVWYSAIQWNVAVNRKMSKGGHCLGMAATSLRFFRHQGHEPDYYQKGATSTHDLHLSNARRNISYYQVEQWTEPMRGYVGQALRTTPTALLAQLQTIMSGGAPDPVVLIMISGGGHAVTPYAIEDRGSGVFWVKVYDNNFKDDATRHVVINTTTDTWSYDGGNQYSGTAMSHGLGVVPVSRFAEPPSGWVPQASAPWSSNATTSTTQLWLLGQGHLLVSDSQGRRLGYTGQQFVDEIPGASASVTIGGLGVSDEPVYTLPATENYKILLDGQTLTGRETSTLTMFGRGFAVTASEVLLTSATRDMMAVAPDGTGISYRATESKAVTLTLSLDTPAISRKFDVRSTEIDASQSITLTDDSANGALVFSKANASGGTYDLGIGVIDDTGTQQFTHRSVSILSGDTHYLIYDTWDGAGGMELRIDHSSDGTVDQTVVLDNQSCSIFLPLLMRGG